MKRAVLMIAAMAVLVAPAAYAQNQGEVGVYADYFRLAATGTNFGGVGARLSVNAVRFVQLEGEMNYDFNQGFTEGFENTTTGAISLQRSDMRILHGLFGPKLQTGVGPVRLFVTVKGGFADFMFDPRPATFNTFTSSVTSLRADSVVGVLYPGGGVEAYVGPIGLRIDVGDEIYFANSARNNWRVTFGPTIRF